MATRGFSWRSKTDRYGAAILYCTFSIPYTEGGKVKYRRVERSTGTADPAEARIIAQKLKAEEHAKLAEPKAKPQGELTFAHAVKRYLATGRRNIHLVKIGDAIAGVPLSQIDQAFIDDLSHRLFPGRTDATRNTQCFTPIIAVLHAATGPDYRPPRIRRPKDCRPRSNFSEPPKDWWSKVVEAAPPNLGALIFFMRLHGRRIGEACAIRPSDIDRDSWTVAIADTKTNQRICYPLSKPVIELLSRYPWWSMEFVFGFWRRHDVYPQLKRACENAGIPYHRPKDAGRHSFATGFLREGKTLAFVKEAGRWKNIQTVDRNYSHLEHRDIDDEARALGEAWAERQFRKAAVIAPDFAAAKMRKENG